MSPAKKTAAPAAKAEEEVLETIIECPLNYTMSDEKGEPLAGGEALAKVDAEALSVKPKTGESQLISLREIIGLNAADYRVNISLSSGEHISFFNLGYRYEDFVHELIRARNEVLLTDMLMYETVLKKGVKATYTYSEGERSQGPGACEVRVLETGLLVLPDTSDPIRLPFAYVSGLQDVDYRLTLSTERGATLVLSMLGREFDPVKKALSDAMNALSLQAQKTFKELVPLADPATIRKASRYIRDGRAAMKKDLDAVSPKIWPDMEKKISDAGVGDEYGKIKALAQQDRLCIGVKKGLSGDTTGEYVWFLAPVYDTGGKPGNAIIMEAVSVSPEAEEEPEAEVAEPENSGETSAEEAVDAEDVQKSIGKATYLFRIVSRKDYPGMSKEMLDTATDEAIRQMNDCMIAINFRREPIYVSDDQLREPENLQYLYSVQRLPELRFLRARFVGRVKHSGKGQWSKDLESMLAFCAKPGDDSEKWAKGK